MGTTIRVGGHVVLDVGGQMEIDDGAGGVLVHSVEGTRAGSAYTVHRGGLLSASYESSALLLLCVVDGGGGRVGGNGDNVVCNQVSALTPKNGSRSGGGGVGGTVSWSCEGGQCEILPVGGTGGGRFEVRALHMMQN